MARIQCPHCSAVNQDVTLEDPCWQCGAALGAPVKVAEPNDSDSAGSSLPRASSPGPIQKPLEQVLLRDAQRLENRSRLRSPAILATVVVTIAIMVIAVLILLRVIHA